MAAVDLTAWRALVDKELAGAPFDKLVQRTAEGIAIEPLYTERPAEAPFARGAAAAPAPWKLCVRVAPGADLAAEIAGGAEALWCRGDDRAAAELAAARGLVAVMEPVPPGAAQPPSPGDDSAAGDDGGEFWSAFDWIGEMARGRVPADIPSRNWPLSRIVEHELDIDPGWRCIRVTGLPFHDAGADAADELALMLSSLVATLRHLDDAKIDIARIGSMLWAQVAIGRDTFGELCKLRALRVLWHKALGAAGVAGTRLDAIHAVCSARTLSQRDPWVNMLRVTTQVFAAALGGAQLITPQPFDGAFAAHSALGERVARNTALVLREESQLGRVIDAAGGSYYIESRTDALAREAWSRFQAIERDGGVAGLIRTGQLQARLDAAWAARAAALAKRKEPVLGVSEFANLREQLPGAPRAPSGVHRDSEAFEALRARVEAAPRRVALALLGSPAEHRARVGFAENLFAVAGIAAAAIEAAGGEAAAGEAAAPLDVVCICGSDERYATEAADAARRLKAAGASRVVLAGRPGALEAELRAAGLDGFIFVGCDVLAVLEEILA